MCFQQAILFIGWDVNKVDKPVCYHYLLGIFRSVV
jgi:hypothetical protein